MKQEFTTWYNKNYKKLLVLPSILLALSIIYLGFFYIQNNDIIHKDVSLTGGTTITIFTDASLSELEQELSSEFPNLIVRGLSDNTGKQDKVIITVPDDPEKLQSALENYLGFELDEKNSSIEFTGSSLSEDFYQQLLLAVTFAFLLMALVVFIIFAKKFKIKLLAVLLTLVSFFFITRNNTTFFILAIITILATIYIYIKYSIPSFAVILSAFADITMTLAVIDLIGMEVSTAGIVALLMLIGYSVDTDILLTTRLLRRNKDVNNALFGAFKTGTMMTLTSIIAIAAALIIVFQVSEVLTQIFTVLLIGLGFDLFNTWITNASIIKWYTETR